jgi:hypothetical protein
MPARLLDRIGEIGLSFIVGTADAGGMPSSCRGFGARVEDDARAMTVWVPVGTGQAVIANLPANPWVAMVICEPLSHETIQVKGSSSSFRLGTPDEEELVRRQMDLFARTLGEIGLPGRIASRINRWPAFAISFAIDRVFDQTPGPKAGSQMK